MRRSVRDCPGPRRHPRLVVVTQEAGGTADKPRIPFVCDREGVRHIDLLTLIEEEDWTF